MTREEAIKELEEDKALYMPEEWIESLDRDTPDGRLITALDMAIKALEQQTCEDVIDRAEAMTEIMMFAGNVKSDEEDIYIKVSDAMQLLRELPSVTPQPRTGQWTRVTDKTGHLVWECNCGWQQRLHTNFCPDCGIKMENQS